MVTTLRTLVLTSVVLCHVAGPAQAQTAPSSRPFRGLFGGDAARESAGTHSEVRLSVLGGYDDDVLRGDARRDPRSAVGGQFAAARAEGNFMVARPSGSFAMNVSGIFRYYPELDRLTTGSYTASLRGARQVGARTTVSADQFLYYRPHYTTSFLSNAEGPPDMPEFSGDGDDYGVMNTPARSRRL